MAKRGLKENTRRSYGIYFEYWKEFCEWMNVDLLSISENSILNFLAWCHRFTHLNSDLASKAVTAAISYHKDNGISFDRKSFPSIKRHVDGYRDSRPPERRPKLPFSEYHVQQTFVYCVDENNYDSVMIGCALLIGYSLLLRPGEIGHQPRSTEKNLLNNAIQWHPSFLDPKEISTEVEASKTNRWKHKTEIIYTSCNCEKSVRITPCPVHYLKLWIHIRNRFHKRIFKDSDFLFVHRNGSPFKYDNLNNWMHNVIGVLNKKLNLNMDPNKYTPHSLRQGGCTDLARYGVPSWRIEMKGRWRSKMWRHTYINTDWRDMALLANCTVTELLNKIVFQPYE